MNDRMERIRALLPDSWRLGAEFDQPDPMDHDGEPVDDFDDGVEMAGRVGVDLEDFGRYCVPSAMSVVSAMPRLTAARALLELQVRAGEIVAPRAPMRHAALALHSYGYSVQPVGLGDWLPTMSEDDFLASIEIKPAKQPARRAPSFPEQARDAGFSAEAIETGLEAYRKRVRARPTLADFLASEAPGRYLVCVATPDDPLLSHALGVIDGHVLAGDEAGAPTYGNHPLLEIVRVESKE